MVLNAERLSKTISACIENGNKLIEDAKILFELERFSTALALSILAQEEFAKALILRLVADDALPWLPEIRQSIARHECKHLLAVVMEWLPPSDAPCIIEQWTRNHERHERWMAWSARRLERLKHGNCRPDPDDPEPGEEPFYFPTDIAAALNIFRHEQIEKLRSGGQPWSNPDWATGWVRKIADGSLDRKKQSAFYVDVTKTGEIGLHPGLITREEASEAIKRAAYLSDGPITYSDEYHKLEETLATIFANLKDTSQKRWYVRKGKP